MNLDIEQKQAVEALGKNILVSASAGAGKTGVLVQRLKKRVIQDRVRVSRILAMTFTAAAASEMKKRLAKELHTAFLETTSDEEKAWLSEQLVELEAANITTIDSYCLTIIKKYYSVIGLDPATAKKVLSQGSVNIYKKDAYLNTLAKYIENDPALSYKVISYFSARAEDYDSLYSIINTINTHAQSTIDPDDWYQQAISSYAPISRISDLSQATLENFFSRLSLDLNCLLSYLNQMRFYGDGDEKIKFETLDQ